MIARSSYYIGYYTGAPQAVQRRGGRLTGTSAGKLVRVDTLEFVIAIRNTVRPVCRLFRSINDLWPRFGVAPRHYNNLLHLHACLD